MAHMVVCSYSSGSGSRLEDVFIQKTNGMGIFFRGETTNQIWLTTNFLSISLFWTLYRFLRGSLNGS